MNRVSLAVSASALAFAAASPAAAQNFYLGVGVEHGIDGNLHALGTDYSNDLNMGSVIGGVQFNSGNFFFGAEGETTLFTDYDSDWCSCADLDRVSRARAIGGYDFGQVSAFAAVGKVWVDGDVTGGGVSADSADGLTYGI